MEIVRRAAGRELGSRGLEYVLVSHIFVEIRSEALALV